MKKLFYIFCMACVIVGCARMGNPDGGWFDDDPPVVIGSNPADKSTNVKNKKVTILFNEFIKIEDATNKVIVSPPQLEVPEIKASGKKIIVELQDTLKDNMTYTVDFSDAIVDNNEGNPLGSYTYTFSTGDQIDTLEVSGYVLEASNLEPVKGLLVGLYDDLADSAFKTKPMLRVSRTDSRGHFVIKGIAPGTYRAYALKDLDGNFRFTQKSEMIAFNHQTFEPSWKPDTRVDTVWRDSLHIDALLQVPYTHFLPDDITLLAFTQIQTDRYLIKTERKDPEKFSMFFSYGDSILPVIKGLNFNSDSAFVIEAGEKLDSIHYWLRDTMLVNQDTLRMEVSYRMTDTLGNLVNQTDTLDVLAKTPLEKRLKEKAKEMEKWQKEQDKKKKRKEPYDSVMAVKPLTVKMSANGRVAPNQRFYMEMPQPLNRCDTSAIHLNMVVDSLLKPVPCELRQLSVRRYELVVEWQEGEEYSLEIDSAAFEGIYGLTSNTMKQTIKVGTVDDYSSLLVEVSGVSLTDSIVVQLLDGSDKVVRQSVADAEGVAEFLYLKPGAYYLRAYIDKNGNGQWDTGNYDQNLQPEPVYYHQDKIDCKQKWDVSREWNLTARPLYNQKPMAITKQKPDKQKQQLRNRNLERARELGKEYIPKGI